MTTIKEKKTLSDAAASRLNPVATFLLASVLLVSAASCGEGKKDMDQAAENATAKVDDIKQEYRENRDENMVKDIAESNAEELLLIELIRSNATAKDLKSAMTDMKNEHENLAGQLTEYAAGHQITLDNKAETPEVNTDKTGVAWDHEAVKELLDKHKESVQELQKAADKATEPGLKTWAAQTLPGLQQHEATLENWQQKLKM